ncbi:hypothetical protein GBAR_LOCUS11619 [Geodia barretti]|uniref:Uncharacterized protein n=1 Tax=Geodia barretti TaxID=519541 RepID=A0AA35WJE0_GEOBA|nr:hypothetical protein GBAR_LOCUS11619 [Geodia barretti]
MMWTPVPGSTELREMFTVWDRNEKRLAQECSRRMDLESRLESLTPRHSEAGIRKTAAMESLKVASEQASLAEAQATSLEVRCREKREEIGILNEKMEEQKIKEEAALSEFSVKMAELADKFRTARTYYTEPQLTSEMEVCDKDIKELTETVATKKTRLAQLTSELAQLQQHEQEEEEHGGEGRGRIGVSREQWQILLDMVTEERGVAKVELEREEQKLRAVQSNMMVLNDAQPMGAVMREE